MSYFFIDRPKEAHFKNIILFLKRFFFADAPLCRALKYCTSENDHCPDYEKICLDALTQDMSLIARDAEGNIIGTLVNAICVNIPTDIETLINQVEDPKFQKFLRVISTRESANLPTKYPNDKEMFEIKVAATDRAWRNKGVMKKLMEEAEKMAIQRNFRLIRIDVSSFYSAKAAEKHGYTCVHEKLFKDITMEGKPIVVPEPPHTVDKIYIKELF